MMSPPPIYLRVLNGYNALVKKVSGRVIDAALAAAIFVTSASIGVVYVATYEPVPYFLQHMFGPAVMWSCGRGFENPKLSDAPALEDFLYWRRPCFDCAQLPPDIPVVPADPFALTDEQWKEYHPHPEFAGWTNCQQFHKYMLMSAALLWRLFGVSWRALLPLYALLYGVAGAASYCLFRLAMKRPPAFVMALLLVFAPLQLQQLPDLRDFAKAPFFLSAIFMMGLLASRRMSRRSCLALSAVCGLTLGIGIGFRQDALICAPAFAAVVLLFFPGRIRETCKIRAGALIVFLIVFMISGGPILTVLFTKANNSTHDTLIGFTRYCDERLGVGASLYDFGDPFVDEYTRAVVEGYNERTTGTTGRLRHYTHDYDVASSRYFKTLALTFPADLVTRAYASVLRVVDELRSATDAPRGLENPVILALYKAHAVVTRALLTHGRYVAAVALLLIAARNLRLGLCALFLLCWFAGYPSLRFSVRHAFHLQFVSFFAAGLVLQQAWLLAQAVYRKQLHWSYLGQFAGPYVKRAAIFSAIAAVGLSAPLWALRAYQSHSVGHLLRAYESAPRTPAAYSVQQNLLQPTEANPAGMPYRVRMLAISGPAGALSGLRMRYEPDAPMWDFSRIIDIPPSMQGQDVTVYVPVYMNERAQYSGIELPAGANTARVRVDKVEDLSRLPVLLTAILPHDWDKYPRCYEIRR